MSFLKKTCFYTTVAELSGLDAVHSQAEVAFAGRSNVGKSTVINTLAGQTRLAFSSKTPGRTQHLNYFSVEPDRYLVDLPGYGYAKVPAQERLRWRTLLEGYLQQRQSLVGLVLIMDIRHPLTPLDWQFLNWFAPTGRPIHVILNKSDKLNRSTVQQTIRQVSTALAEKSLSATVDIFSSLNKIGLSPLSAVLADWLGIASRRTLSSSPSHSKTSAKIPS